MTTLMEKRESLGMSRSALAKQVPFQHETLIKIESGLLLPTSNAARKTAAILGVEVADIYELRAAIEKAGNEGDPCDCVLACGGTKVAPKNPRSWLWAISLPCKRCNKPRTFEPGNGLPHGPYCSPCESRILSTERLKTRDHPLAFAVYEAIQRNQTTVPELCRGVGVSTKAFWEWMNRKVAPRLQKLLSLAEYLNAPEIINIAYESTSMQKSKFTVICPDCMEVRQAYITQLKEIKQIDYFKRSAVCLCGKCQRKGFGKARIERSKEVFGLMLTVYLTETKSKERSGLGIRQQLEH